MPGLNPLTRLCLALAVAAVALMMACGDNGVEEKGLMSNDVPIAVQFYSTIGFQQSTPYEATGGRGTTQWGAYGPPNVWPPRPWSGFAQTWPEIGWYASKDIKTIKWQVEQIQTAGIDTVIISWHGWGDPGLDGNVQRPDLGNEYQEATKMLLDYIKETRIPLKFALFVDAFTYHVGGRPQLSTNDLTDEQRQMVTDYLWDSFYAPSKYGDFALHLKGKPATFWGSDVPGGWFLNHNWTDDRFTLIEVSSYHIEDVRPDLADSYNLTTAYIGEPPPSDIPGPDGIVNIWPRSSPINPYVANMPGFEWLNPPRGGNPDKPTIWTEVDPLGTEGLYDEAWKQIIEHPERSEIKMIWIWYWNSYWEMAYVEPDAGIGAYAVGDLYVRKTAHYANLFQKGLPFQYFDEPDESSRYIGDVDHTDLKLRSPAEKEKLLRDIPGQSVSMVAKYTRREINTLDDMPEGLKSVTLRIAANAWRQVMAARKDPLFSAESIGQGFAPVVSDDIWRELQAWRKSPSTKVIFAG